jgi:spore photoproduct lyase
MEGMSGIFQPSFSHIYIERGAEDYPLTREVLKKFPAAVRVPVGHYKDIFNRAGQDFAVQKHSPKLILAVRRDKFLLPGSGLCDDFGYGYENFYYAAQMFNCPYDCAYCYLRGMYASANIVAFVNTADYFTAANALRPRFISVSYDADLLAMERIFHFVEGWMGYAINNPSVEVEVRTKSASFAAIAHIVPVDNVVLSWTLSPAEYIVQYERNAPGLTARLFTINEAVKKGWKVRLCIDPVLLVPSHIPSSAIPFGTNEPLERGISNDKLAAPETTVKTPAWETAYTEMIETARRMLDFSKLHGISVGGFRVPKTFYKRMLRLGGAELLRALPLTERDGVMRYSDADENKMNLFGNYLSAQKSASLFRAFSG